MAQPQPATIRIEGLKELRRALKAAEGANPRELTRALKVAGEPVPPAIRAKTPVRTGELKASVGKSLASGTKGRVPIKARHAAIAEFSTKGRYGATMTARYGAPPRFGYKGLDSVSDQVADIAYKELKEIVTAYGWFKE